MNGGHGKSKKKMWTLDFAANSSPLWTKSMEMFLFVF